MITRDFKKSDLPQVCKLIQKAFKKFNYSDGTKEASERYITYFDFTKNKERLENTWETEITLVAEDNGKITGILRGDKDRLYNLFVDAKYQKLGIGSSLLKRYLVIAKKLGSKQIKTRAASYAIPFYTKQGFKKTTGVRSMRGINVQPMKRGLE